MTHQTCPRCLGTGQIITEDGAATTCRCIALRQALTEVVRTPGLENVKRLGKACVPHGVPIEGHAVIATKWPEARECIAGWLFHHFIRGEHQTIKILTCADLRTLYVTNAIEGLRGLDLVVVRALNARYGADMTKDALMVALTMGPPVWVVHSLDNDFGEGHPAWSAEIEDELSDATRIDLGTPPPSGPGNLAFLGIGEDK